MDFMQGKYINFIRSQGMIFSLKFCSKFIPLVATFFNRLLNRSIIIWKRVLIYIR